MDTADMDMATGMAISIRQPAAAPHRQYHRLPAPPRPHLHPPRVASWSRRWQPDQPEWQDRVRQQRALAQQLWWRHRLSPNRMTPLWASPTLALWPRHLGILPRLCGNSPRRCSPTRSICPAAVSVVVAPHRAVAPPATAPPVVVATLAIPATAPDLVITAMRRRERAARVPSSNR